MCIYIYIYTYTCMYIGSSVACAEELLFCHGVCEARFSISVATSILRVILLFRVLLFLKLYSLCEVFLVQVSILRTWGGSISKRSYHTATFSMLPMVITNLVGGIRLQKPAYSRLENVWYTLLRFTFQMGWMPSTIYIYIYIYIYVCMCVYIYIYMYTCMYIIRPSTQQQYFPELILLSHGT